MSQKRRICSLLPSATEIICALGHRASLVGVSHACDYPADVRGLPAVTKSIVPPGLSSREIDDLVTAALRDGRSLYELDVAEVNRLQPDVIVTQELCDVCAVDYATVARSLSELNHAPELVSLQPSNINDIFEDVDRVARSIGCESEAEILLTRARAKLGFVATTSSGYPARRLAALEWLDPLFFGGHWVPEQILVAGGQPCFGQAQSPSARLSWEELEQSDPDIIVLMPCGYNLQQTISLAHVLKSNHRYKALRAVQAGDIWAVDANSYFSRPSPRVVQGAEILAHILSPSTHPWEGETSAFARISDL